MIKIGIIIPAHNEKLRIVPTLEAYGKFFTERSKLWLDMEFQILISINGTTDNTQELVEEAMKKYPIISYINNPDSGKGLAVTRGFNYFLKQKDINYIGFVDADMSTSAEEMFRLILHSYISNKNIIANRYDKESVLNPPPGFKRTLASRTFNFIVRSLFPSLIVRDSQCGCKIFIVEDLKSIVPSLTMTQWSFDVEILYLLKQNKRKFIEVPTTWISRDYSKVTLGGTSLKMLFSLFRLRLMHSPFKDFIRLYNKIPEHFKFHHYV